MLTERQARECMAVDQEVARQRPAGERVGKTGRRVRSVSLKAVMNAVDTEGREVLSQAGEGYWRDMERRYPWIGGGSDYRSRDGWRSRFGVATRRYVYRDGQAVELRKHLQVGT